MYIRDIARSSNTNSCNTLQYHHYQDLLNCYLLRFYIKNSSKLNGYMFFSMLEGNNESQDHQNIKILVGSHRAIGAKIGPDREML